MIALEEMDIQKIVKDVIVEYKREEREKSKKKAYHNTKLLMQKYNLMHEHVYKVKDDMNVSGLADGFEYIPEEDTWIISICKSKVKSLKMISYIDSALDTIKSKYTKDKRMYEYDAFEMYFIDGKTNEEIATELSCGKNTPKRWIDNVIEDLSVLLWGIEAFEI